VFLLRRIVQHPGARYIRRNCHFDKSSSGDCTLPASRNVFPAWQCPRFPDKAVSFNCD